MQLTIEYDTELFKPESIDKIGKHLIRIFELFAENMDMNLIQARESFLTPEEKKEQENFLNAALEIEEEF